MTIYLITALLSHIRWKRRDFRVRGEKDLGGGSGFLVATMFFFYYLMCRVADHLQRGVCRTRERERDCIFFRVCGCLFHERVRRGSRREESERRNGGTLSGDGPLLVR